MLSAYPACFFKEEPGYSVIFPDLNYLSTCGDTIEDAFAMAVDCLAGYLFEAKKDGDVIPYPSALQSVSLEDVAQELELNNYQNAFVNIVTVDVEEYAKTHFNKAVKKTLTIPQWLNDSATAARHQICCIANGGGFDLRASSARLLINIPTLYFISSTKKRPCSAFMSKAFIISAFSSQKPPHAKVYNPSRIIPHTSESLNSPSPVFPEASAAQISCFSACTPADG